METQIVKYNITDTAIAEMKQNFLSLKINGIEDTTGYLVVKSARIEVKGLRIDIEKTRKELKEESLKYGRLVDTEAKRITEQLSSIENYLQSQEKAVDDEKNRIKEEKEQARKKITSDRISGLMKLGVDFNSLDLVHMEKMSDDEYRVHLMSAQDAWDSKQIALAEQERLANEDREKQEIERVKLEKMAAEQKEIQDKIKADQDKLAIAQRDFETAKKKDEDEKNKALEMEKIKQAAIVDAKIQAENKIKQEADEKKRLEELAPDAEKALVYVAMIKDMAKLPITFKSKQISKTISDTKAALNVIANDLENDIQKTSLKRKAA